MRAATPRKLSPLRISYGDGLRSGRQTVPDLLDQLQPILDAKPESVLEYRAHVRILRW